MSIHLADYTHNPLEYLMGNDITFTVDLPPTLNEIISANRTIKRGKNKQVFVGAKQKENHTNKVARAAKKALRACPLHPVYLFVYYRVSSRSRDVDNIQACKKFILDGLVKAGILPKDSFAYIAPTITETFAFIGHSDKETVTIHMCDKEAYVKLVLSHINEITQNSLPGIGHAGHHLPVWKDIR